MALDRQDKALREFKQIIQDLVHLLRTSTKCKLTYMCWVNRSRQQFVWEANSTGLPNVMFKDRVAFGQHFLDKYKDIEEIVHLRVGEDVSKAKLIHYFEFVQAKEILIIPFINKGETVALTVLESEEAIIQEEIHDRIVAYNNAMVNVLDTYLEVVDLHEQQSEWEDYEESLNRIDFRKHRVDILQTMLDEMQRLLPNGGAALVCPGMESWSVVLSAANNQQPPKLGMQLQEKSVAYDALEKGSPVFTMHFNNNPRRVSVSEKRTEGATLAIPIKIHDRRQGVVICYDSDPLSFKESTKHKLINLGRTAALSIQTSYRKNDMAENILTHNFDCFLPELWEKALEIEIARVKEGQNIYTWFGLVTPGDSSTLRTKFRLEELQRIQGDFVEFLNPARHNECGYLGFNSDYVYAFIVQSDSEDAVENWMNSVRRKTDTGLKLSGGGYLNVNFKAGYTMITRDDSSSYQVLEKAKKALSKVLSDQEMELYQAS
ncbi:GAF domain-containing protein [Balneola sp. MJW-20]|uniref:GAF domain-containing protein n=1 Tax=Gracilimonas aurantiaca TaxID=3234185 RepID=UPI0034652D9E